MSKIYNHAGFAMKTSSDFSDECMRAHAIVRLMQEKLDGAGHECFLAGYHNKWLGQVYELRLDDLRDAQAYAAWADEAMREYFLSTKRGAQT